MSGMKRGTVVRCLLAAGVVLGLSGCGMVGGHGSLAAGAKYESSGNYRGAYIEAKKVLQKDSKNGAAWLLLAKASLMLGNPQDALSDLQNAQANGVPESEWAVPLGRVLLITQKYAELLKQLSPDGVTSSADKLSVYVLRGDAYIGLKQTAQAAQAYHAALALNPKDPSVLVGLAKLAVSENDLDAAVGYVQQALNAAPDYSEAWIQKGDLAFAVLNYAGAEQNYQKALDIKSHALLPQQQFYARSRLADAQIQQDKLAQALGNVQTLEKMSPAQPYPHYLHAVIYYKQQHFDEATSQLQQVLKIVPNNEPAQLLMGAVNYAQGNFGQAEMYLSNVMGMDQKNTAARRLLALTLYREGRTNQAVDMLRQALPGKPSDAELLAVLQHQAEVGFGGTEAPPGASSTAGSSDARLASASQLIAAGNEQGALRLLEALPDSDRSLQPGRYSLMVQAYLKENHPAEAVRVAAEFVKKEPRSSDAHLLYGTALVAAGKRVQARAEYLESSKLDSKNLAPLFSLASLDMLEGQVRDASNVYQQVLKKDSRNALAMTALGRVAASQGNKREAVKWFKEAISTAPKFATPYLGLIAVYGSSAQFAEARDTARQLMAIAPDDPATLDDLGAVQLNTGQYQDALPPLEKAVKLSPQNALYRANLARAQILNKNIKGAEDNLHQVIQAAPTDVSAVTLLAFLKLQEGDMPAALGLASSLEKQVATAAQGYSLEGDLYLSKQIYAKAVEAYQHSLKLDYNRQTVMKTFVALNDTGTVGAKDVVVGWLAKHPEDDAMRMLLAQYYQEHAQLGQAAEQYRQVVEKYPSNVDALNNLAWIYTQTGNTEAVSLAERAYKLAPTGAAIQDTYGWALTMNGQAKKALPILLSAVKEAPQAGTLQYHLAVAQARSGDTAGAKTTLQALLKSGASFPAKADAQKLYRDLTSPVANGTDR